MLYTVIGTYDHEHPDYNGVGWVEVIDAPEPKDAESFARCARAGVTLHVTPDEEWMHRMDTTHVLAIIEGEPPVVLQDPVSGEFDQLSLHGDRYPGIHWPADPDGFEPPEGWSWVQRCDEADIYEHDEEAAHALIAKHGIPRSEIRWFDRETREPLDDYREGASCAINTIPKED